MPAIMNVSDAKANLSKLLEQVEHGEEVIIGRNGKAVAVLSAYKGDSTPRQPGMGNWKGKIWIADDFDELPEDLMRAFNGETE
jgi:prevent-host-death family protein